jgi:protein-disulfide isomerase
MPKPPFAAFALLAAFAVPASPCPAAEEPTPAQLAKEIEALKEGQKAIRADLAEIKALLSPRPPAPPQGPAGSPIKETPMDLSGSHVGGDPRATVVLVEFSDFQCPFCAQASNGALLEVNRDFIKTGKVRYAFRHFPLEDLHPNAAAAAEASECAAVQGRFWEMHQLLFDNQKALAPADLSRYAGMLKLDAKAFDGCMEKRTFAERVKQDKAAGAAAGVSGTPSMLIGTARPGEPVVTLSRLVVGAVPYDNLRQAIELVLSRPAGKPARE